MHIALIYSLLSVLASVLLEHVKFPKFQYHCPYAIGVVDYDGSRCRDSR